MYPLLVGTQVTKNDGYINKIKKVIKMSNGLAYYLQLCDTECHFDSGIAQMLQLTSLEPPTDFETVIHAQGRV